jgi:hypothetical protein
MKSPKSSSAASERSEEFERFEAFAKQLISVPKAEIDKRAAEYKQKKRKRQLKRSQKSGK